jgi:hypothetical protein
MAIEAAAPGMIGLAGGLAGELMSAADRERAAELRKRALEQITGIAVPSLESQEVALEGYTSAGQLTPELEAAILQDPSAFAGITTDPRLKEAQLKALLQMQEMGETGLTASERAALNEVRRDVARADQGRRDSILQNMQARGMGGSGAELAAQLQSSQASAERASQESDRLASMAQQRQLEAIYSAGKLGGDIRRQEFGEQSDVARAQDEINRFNAAMRGDVQRRNTSSMNDAQRANLTTSQNIRNANVDVRNKQQSYNKGLIQQQFSNQMRRGEAVSGAQRSAASDADAQAQRTADRFAGVGAGVGQGVGAYMDARQAEDDREYEREQRKLDREAYAGRYGR